MKTLEPSYYEKFECIADKCRDTCCIGWGVTIDKNSYLKYKDINGELGNRINGNIRIVADSKNDEAYGEFVLDSNMKCPLLNKDNLCDLYINKGSDYLSHVCTTYPRIITLYGDIAERNLTLSCPSVAKMLVDKNEKMDFIMNDEIKYNKNECIININELYKEFYDLVWEGRGIAIDIAQFSEIPIWQRLVIIKLMADKIQSRINNGDTSDIDEFINGLKIEMLSKSVINSLNEMEKPSKIIKIDLILMILEIRNKYGGGNKKFSELAENTKILLNNSDDMEETLSNKEEQFNRYFKDREYVLENYMVYNVYNQYMKCLINKNLDIEIFMLIVGYSIIKFFLLAMWDKNCGKLTDDQIVDVLYSLTREMEHSDVFIQSLYDEMTRKGVNNLGYLIAMIY